MVHSIYTLADIQKECHLKYRNFLPPLLMSNLAKMRCLRGRNATSYHETCDVKTGDVEADDSRDTKQQVIMRHVISKLVTMKLMIEGLVKVKYHFLEE